MGKILMCLLLLGSSGFAKEAPKQVTTLRKQHLALLVKQKKLLEEDALLKQKLHDLALKEQEDKSLMARHQEEIATQLLLLARFGRANPLHLLVESTASHTTIRGIILMRALTASLKGKVVKIKAELNDLASLRQDLQIKSQEQQHVLQTIQDQQTQVKALKMETVEDWQKQEEELLAAEDDVNTLLEVSQAVLSKGEQAAQKEAAAKGLPFNRLERPVVGKIIKKAALQNKFSPHSQGMLFETKKNAEVFSPSKGTVVFKGPFRSQGEIVIIDHGKHVHTVFMGMDKISAEVGQNVYAGEKLGVMAGYGKTLPVLYVELRQNGKAINPESYFTN
jgi:septal ring factor EnvC (AmiA/AmiB activator)